MALVAATVASAAASQRDEGWFYKDQCLSWTEPYTFATWKGVGQIMGPGSNYYLTTPYFSDWTNQSVKGMNQGGYWAASGSVDLNLDNTYAYCGDGSALTILHS